MRFGRLAETGIAVSVRHVAFGSLVIATLCSGGASAAEARPKASPPLSSWTGFYFGADIGGAAPVDAFERLQAVSGFSSNAFDLYPRSQRRAGLTFGPQLGYNWRRGRLVYGLETQLNFVDGQYGPQGLFPASPTYAAMRIGSYTLSPASSGTYFASLRGRLGFAIEHALIYLTGGVVTGGWRGATLLTLNGGGAQGDLFRSGSSASSRMKYLVGAGIEYALDANWSARAEYLFLNQSYNTQVYGNELGFAYVSKLWNDTHVLRFGVNYRVPNANAASDSREEANHAPEQTNMHGQITYLPQGYPKFPALYSGPQSLAPPAGQARATLSATGFFGLRLWEGGEAYVNPEIDGGYGLSATAGVAGFPSSEAYKVGRQAPYLRFQRYFIRQTLGLGGDAEQIGSGANQLAGSLDANRLTFTVGKYAVTDIFDDNRYAHDGRSGFMNWAIVDMGAFDYAADAWGYTYGATAELRRDWWTARAGLFQLSRVPNGEKIEPVLFRQFSQIVELEARHSLFFGQPGKVKLLGYGDLGHLGKYDEAVAIGYLTGTTPDVTRTRKKRFKAGGGINIEQPLTDDLGVFFRASKANGRYETDEFTEIERSVSAGAVLSGDKWGRPKDAVGVAAVINGISRNHASYLASGGVGIILGDGRLSYGREKILEAYYKFHLLEGAHLTADYQLVQNPGYNRDRGPASIFALRLHGEF